VVSIQFEKLCGVVDVLLGENGCPWDKEQTHESLRANLLEEAYEVVDTIDNSDKMAMCEELGDLLLLILLNSKIAEKEGHFTIEDVLAGTIEKLISRHTHIFSGEVAQNAEEAEKIWNTNKNKEKSIKTPLENMLAVPKSLPALSRAEKIIKRSGETFLDEKILEEIYFLLNKLETQKTPLNGEKMGRLLFLISIICTKNKINSEFYLTNAIFTFINSFREKNNSPKAGEITGGKK